MRHVLSLTGSERPRVLHVPTATGDSAEQILAFYDRCGGLGDLAHLRFHPWPPAGLRELVLAQDAISVGGGNTANMLAVWRVHGVDRALRAAWEAGVVLAGMSAGSICWFESGTTDSFGPELRPIHDALGFLSGSNCPHYDSEPGRRPLYQRLVATGALPAGYAATDHAGLVFAGTELREVVLGRPGAGAWRVERRGDGAVETDLGGRILHAG